MAFINGVAEIVHENVAIWKGACNKNLGNSFLISWRIGEEQKLIDLSRTMWNGSTTAPLSPASVSHQARFDIRRIPGKS